MAGEKRRLSRLGGQVRSLQWLAGVCLLLSLAHGSQCSLSIACSPHCSLAKLVKQEAQPAVLVQPGGRLSLGQAPASLRTEQPRGIRASAYSAPAAQEPQQSILERVGQFVRRTIAPDQDYFTLIRRFHNWFRQHRQLVQDNPGRGLKEPLEELKEEYARVDEHLVSLQCSEQADESAVRSATLSGDHVLEVLKELVDRLERRLTRLRHQLGQPEASGSLVADENEVSVDAEQVQRAMERVKQTAISKAKQVLASEALTVARIAALHSLAAYAQSRSDIPGDLIGQLAPIIGMLGSPSVSVVAAYLKNTEFRAAMAIARQANVASLCPWGAKKEPTGSW